MEAPTFIQEYVFGGSLCRICEFETLDGLRYCITIFSLSDYKHLHFPHDEYKLFISRLYMLLYPQTILPTPSNHNSSANFTIGQTPPVGDFKIKFEKQSFIVGPVTAFGLVNTAPFTDFDVSSAVKMDFACDSKWGICICERCPVFRRMCDFELSAREIFPHRKPVNIVFDSLAAIE